MNGSSFNASDDPSVSAAAFELVQVLADKGVSADEIRITFSSSSGSSPATTVNIELLSLSEAADTQPCFSGLNGVFALMDIDD